MPKAKEREPGFEESITSLERVVEQLESGELPLERALELYEQGVGLWRRCHTQLSDAERKVELLLRERGEIKVIPFETSKDGQPGETERSPALSNERVGASVAAANRQPVGPQNEDEKDDLDDSFPF